MTNAAKLREELKKEFRYPSKEYFDEAEPHIDGLLDAYAAAVRDEALKEAEARAYARALKGAKR